MLRSKAKAEDSDKPEKSATGIRRRANPTEGPLRWRLSTADIQADLVAVYNDWKQLAQKFRMQPVGKTKPAMVERGKLYYDQEEFVRDDPVVVRSELSQAEFYGRIASLLNNEIIIRLPDDSKTRVYLQHLRYCRVTIRRQPKVSPAWLFASDAHVGVAAAPQGQGQGPAPPGVPYLQHPPAAMPPPYHGGAMLAAPAVAAADGSAGVSEDGRGGGGASKRGRASAKRVRSEYDAGGHSNARLADGGGAGPSDVGTGVSAAVGYRDAAPAPAGHIPASAGGHMPAGMSAADIANAEMQAQHAHAQAQAQAHAHAQALQAAHAHAAMQYAQAHVAHGGQQQAPPPQPQQHPYYMPMQGMMHPPAGYDGSGGEGAGAPGVPPDMPTGSHGLVHYPQSGGYPQQQQPGPGMYYHPGMAGPSGHMHIPTSGPPSSGPL